MDRNVPAELVADVEEVFLGYWPADLMAIVRAPYRSGVLLAYAYRDGGTHIPQETDR
jgi:hypothetical protein